MTLKLLVNRIDHKLAKARAALKSDGDTHEISSIGLGVDYFDMVQAAFQARNLTKLHLRGVPITRIGGSALNVISLRVGQKQREETTA